MIKNNLKNIIRICTILILCGIIICFWKNNQIATGGSNTQTGMFSKLRDVYSRWICAEHGQELRDLNEYSKSVQIKISGNNLIQNGESKSSNYENALIGYILGSGQFKKSVPIEDLKDKRDYSYQESELQNMVWEYMDNFYSKNAAYLPGIAIGESNELIVQEKLPYRISQAMAYAESFNNDSSDNSEMKNISNSKPTISTGQGNYANSVIIGPFKLNVNVHNTNVELLDKNNQVIPNMEVVSKSSRGDFNVIQAINKETEFYIKINKDEYMSRGVSNLKIKNSNSKIYEVLIDFYVNNNDGNQTLIYFTPQTATVAGELIIPLELTQTTSLKIIKVDEDDTSILLPWVTFKIKNSQGYYLSSFYEGGKYTYSGESGNRNDYEVFNTYESGIIEIYGLPFGRYTIEEVDNPNEGYKDDDKFSKVVNITESQKNVEVTVTNKCENIEGNRRFGNVWLDRQGPDKEGRRDNIKTPGVDFNMKGVKVNVIYEYEIEEREFRWKREKIYEYDRWTGRKKWTGEYYEYWKKKSDWDEIPDELYKEEEDRNNKRVIYETTYTDYNGNYEFDPEWELRRKKPDNILEDEYRRIEYRGIVTDVIAIIFEYDGIKYEAVEDDRDSDAEEVTRIDEHIEEDIEYYIEGTKLRTRSEFNESFRTVTEDRAGGTRVSYTYSNHTSKLRYLSSEGIRNKYYQDTQQEPDGFVMYAIYDGKINVRNNNIEQKNFGLYLREQPDIAIVSDMKEVEISINGYTYTYEYLQRFNNVSSDIVNNSNGIDFKFGEEYGDMSYTRSLYPSDIEYEGEDELKMKVTYKVRLINQSTNLDVKVNSIKMKLDGVNRLETEKIWRVNKTIKAQSYQDIYETYELVAEDFKETNNHV